MIQPKVKSAAAGPNLRAHVYGWQYRVNGDDALAQIFAGVVKQAAYCAPRFHLWLRFRHYHRSGRQSIGRIQAADLKIGLTLRQLTIASLWFCRQGNYRAVPSLGY
jgi:hypothetical protein